MNLIFKKVVFLFLFLSSLVAVTAAVSDITSTQKFFPAQFAAGIDPAFGTVQIGHDFSFDVVAYPTTPSSPTEANMNRFSEFTINVLYDSNILQFINAENPAESSFSIPGKMDLPLIEQGDLNGKSFVRYTQSYFGFPTPLSNTQIALVEFTFLPLQSGTTEIELPFVHIPSPRTEDAIDSTKLSGLILSIEGLGGAGLSGNGCQPECSGKQCGPDGCGGICGDCQSLDRCQQGQCACVPKCSGKNCGSDGCGGICGECVIGQGCSQQGLCATGIGGSSTKLDGTKPTTQKPSSDSDNNIFLIVGIVLILGVIGGGIWWYMKSKKTAQLAGPPAQYPPAQPAYQQPPVQQQVPPQQPPLQ